PLSLHDALPISPQARTHSSPSAATPGMKKRAHSYRTRSTCLPCVAPRSKRSPPSSPQTPSRASAYPFSSQPELAASSARFRIERRDVDDESQDREPRRMG